MKKQILLIALSMLVSATINAQKQQWYAIITASTNAMLENFDCETHKQVKFVSDPIPMLETHELAKKHLTDQFFDYLYNNERDKLDQIAGLTRMYSRYILFGKSPEEVTEKAKRYGAYTTRSSYCGIQKNDTYKIYKFSEFKFDPNKTISKERADFLKEYIDPKK